MTATAKHSRSRRLLAATAVAMAMAVAGGLAAHQYASVTHVAADGGVIHTDGIQGTG